MSATSIEQSKRLLELGLDPNTADMSWVLIYDENHMMSDYRLDLIPYKFNSAICHPAWSLPALMEVIPYPLILTKVASDHYRLCHASYKIDIHEVSKATSIDAMVEMIEWLGKEGYMGKEGDK